MLFADQSRSNKNKVSIFVPMLGKGKVSETDTNVTKKRNNRVKLMCRTNTINRQKHAYLNFIRVEK